MEFLYSRLYAGVAKALKSTLTFAVSRSIELETKSYLGGLSFEMHVLQPGVGVDHEKLNNIPSSLENVDAFFFSRLSPEKGIFDLPEIAFNVAQNKPDLKFLFAGRFGLAAFKNRFDGLVAAKKLGGKLMYRGFLPESELYGLVKSSRVLLYPSRHDAFPLVVLETLACGTPVIAYGIPAITSNFPSDVVMRVPVGDTKQMAAQASKIIMNPELRHSLSEKAKAFTLRYSWGNVATAEVNAYGRVFAFNTRGCLRLNQHSR